MTRCCSQTQQCFWLLSNRPAVENPRPPTCSGSEEAVTPDKDISTTPGNPSSNQMEGVTSNPATPCRSYPLRLQKPPESELMACFLLFVIGGRNAMPPMFTRAVLMFHARACHVRGPFVFDRHVLLKQKLCVVNSVLNHCSRQNNSFLRSLH